MTEPIVFQERHTTGFLWWKITYYKYWRYSEGRMVQLYMDSTTTVESVERGK